MLFSQFGANLPHFFDVLIFFDLVIFNGLLIGPSSLIQIDRLLLDRRRWLELRLVEDDLLFLYGILQVDEFITRLPHDQGCVQLGLNKFGIGFLQFNLFFRKLFLKLRSIQRRNPIPFLHDCTFVDNALNDYLPDLKTPQRLGAQYLHRTFGLQLTGGLDLDAEFSTFDDRHDIRGGAFFVAFHNKITDQQDCQDASNDQKIFLHGTLDFDPSKVTLFNRIPRHRNRITPLCVIP